jgi:hypothetical protein
MSYSVGSNVDNLTEIEARRNIVLEEFAIK